MECQICTEKFNLSNRKNIKCQYCDFEACRSCCEKYILDKECLTCMDGSCNKEWTRKFIVENFTKKFISNELKAMNEKICFDREKSLLPETLAFIEEEKQKNLLKKQVEEIKKNIRLLTQQKNNLEIMIAYGGDVIKNTYNNKMCPDSECRGFLNNQNKCGICEKYFCKECNKLLNCKDDEHHICNKDDLATAKLLASDTKACPNCRVPIHKILGCDQMWCVQCHTGFSWKTGKIEHKIHNPHYYEYQRNQNGGTAPRNPGDYECGRTIVGPEGRNLFINIRKNFETLIEYSTKLMGCNNNEKTNVLKTLFEKHKNKMERILKKMIHLQNYEANQYLNDGNNNRDLRVKYLNNEITEIRFKKLIQQRNKKQQKENDIYHICNLLIQTFTHIIYRYDERINGEINIIRGKLYPLLLHSELYEKNYLILVNILNVNKSYLKEIASIIDYCDNLLLENSSIYNSKKLVFNLMSSDYRVLY